MVLVTESVTQVTAIQRTLNAWVVEWRVSHDVETLNWRAVCGKTARTVRREGSAKALLYPYREGLSSRRTPGSTTPYKYQTECNTKLVSS